MKHETWAQTVGAFIIATFLFISITIMAVFAKLILVSWQWVLS